MTIEIVDVPSYNMVDLSIFFLKFTRPGSHLSFAMSGVGAAHRRGRLLGATCGEEVATADDGGSTAAGHGATVGSCSGCWFGTNSPGVS